MSKGRFEVEKKKSHLNEMKKFSHPSTQMCQIMLMIMEF